ncbi:anti-sigma factor [Oceanibium sediminis]|uniref:anti-sigma factor n=1 Tax=Oceanibium sediminis TaxID=2026339 RepID=UPI000DD359B7|nr:anti-sigma factor [Oceanibium sediminis]
MTDAPEHRDRDDALAAEYVLGVLPHAERVVFAMRLEHSEQLQARVAFWQAQLAPLTDEVAPVQPPARVKSGLEHRLFGEAPAKRGLWNAVGLWRGLGLVGVAASAALAVALVQMTRSPPPGPAPAYVAELTGESGQVRMLALFEPETGQLRLNRTSGTAEEARVFQLWVIADDNPPVSLGILPQDTSGSVTIPEDLGAALAGGVLAISDEPAGGSPTGQPTGEVLAVGQMAPL